MAYSAILFATAAIILRIGVPIYNNAHILGFGRVYEQIGNCRVVPGPVFCEHEVKYGDTVILSCDANRLRWNTVMGPLIDPEPKGQLWVYDYNKVKKLDFELDGDFHPLGMAVYKDDLYVINHRRTGPTIEVIDLKTSKHKKTFPAEDNLRSANALTVISPDNIYITNDHQWPRLRHGHLAMLETFGNLVYPKTFITHLNSTGSSIAKSQFPFANGITHADSGVYVASSSHGTVTRFEIVDHRLVKKEEIDFGYAIDNIHIQNGELIVGGHPDVIALMKVAAGKDVKAPSWISKAKKIDGEWSISTLFQDDGNRFQTATGGVYDEKRNILVAGGLYEKGILVCNDVQ